MSRDILWKAVHGSLPLIEVDQGVDLPVLEQTIGREIVAGGIQTEVCERDTEFMFTKASITYRKLILSWCLAPIKFISMGSSVFKSEFRQ